MKYCFGLVAACLVVTCLMVGCEKSDGAEVVVEPSSVTMEVAADNVVVVAPMDIEPIAVSDCCGATGDAVYTTARRPLLRPWLCIRRTVVSGACGGVTIERVVTRPYRVYRRTVVRSVYGVTVERARSHRCCF